MTVLKIAAAVVIGYLFGSVSYAFILTRVAVGKDIRSIGNANAGTMNVLRSVGKKWGVLVGFMDGLESLVPMLFVRLVLFPEISAGHFFAVLAAGIAALIGHWKPVFHGFRGGRGVGCVIGIFLFIIPFEFLISFLLGGLIVIFFVKKVRFRFGRWVPILFVLITPFLTLALSYLVDLRLSDYFGLGGHPWYVVAGVFITSLAMLGINLSFIGTRVDELQGKETED